MIKNDYCITNNQLNPYNSTAFKGESTGLLTKPIETVTNAIESATDIFIKEPEDKEKKHAKRNAIAVGSSVLVLSAVVALLNPKYSGKLATKLKTLRSSIEIKAKGKSWINKAYEACGNFLGHCGKVLEFTNNINSGKDIGFKWLCTQKKQCKNIKNKTTRKIVTTIDNGFVSIMKKPYETVTRWFDNIGKFTVKRGYKNSNKSMDALERLIRQDLQKIPAGERAKIEQKLAEITKMREHFAEENILARLTEQGKAMQNLEEDFLKRYRSYKRGYTNHFKNRSQHTWDNMSFWAQDIIQPKRTVFERQGNEAVEQLIGNVGGKQGAYNEILELMRPHLSSADTQTMESFITKVSKRLRKSNANECIEYFDKKRDLVLGSAPTDVVTALGGLGLSGIALGTADNKDERISRLLTGVFPIIAGLGASMAFTAMLFSGVKGMLYGTLTSAGLSGIGNFANRQILGNKTPEEVIKNA